MISLVIHVGVFFAAIIGAFATYCPPATAVGEPPAFRCMDIAMVQVASLVPAASPPPAPRPAAVENADAPPPSSLTPAEPDYPIRSAVHEAGPAEPASVVTTSNQPTIRADLAPLPAGAATVFGGVPAVGSTVVFVIDRSASMGLDGRLDRARQELVASIRRLPTSARFQVIPYHRLPEPLIIGGYRGLQPATPGNIDKAVVALDQLIPEGATDHVAAIRAALALQPDVIYFLTDDDELTIGQVQELTRANRGRSCIHALCFVDPFGDSALPALAKTNRGTFKVFR